MSNPNKKWSWRVSLGRSFGSAIGTASSGAITGAIVSGGLGAPLGAAIGGATGFTGAFIGCILGHYLDDTPKFRESFNSSALLTTSLTGFIAMIFLSLAPNQTGTCNAQILSHSLICGFSGFLVTTAAGLMDDLKAKKQKDFRNEEEITTESNKVG